MKLEAGKYYRSRKGLVMGPLQVTEPGCPQRFKGLNDGIGPMTYWFLEGNHMEDGRENPEDLIYEIPTHPITPDMVNEPPHYKAGGIECIGAIEAALTPEEFRGYCKGNALKYAWREKHKGGDEDLKKAQWYLNRLTQK